MSLLHVYCLPCSQYENSETNALTSWHQISHSQIVTVCLLNQKSNEQIYKKNRTRNSQRCIHCHNQNVKEKKKKRKNQQTNVQIWHSGVTVTFSQCIVKSIKGFKTNNCLYGYMFYMCLQHNTAQFSEVMTETNLRYCYTASQSNRILSCNIMYVISYCST
jgi:hypothetical protein